MAESRFRILEELLVAWILDLGSRGVSANGKKITAQAFEIHRMLSDFLVDPLPPCKFSSGWLKRFKSRCSSSLATIQGANSTGNMEKCWRFEGLSWLAFQLGGDDIYTCSAASMYLNMLPTSFYDDSRQESSSNGMDASNAS
ncbi:hypothetical protein BGZ65_008470, partial [Modicella reniformis]